MNAKQALQRLESLGTAQNRKVYARHGVTGPAFGVSYANLGKLKKEIGPDREVALGLWASGNHDARVLACMVSDPAQVKAKELDGWVRQVDNHVIGDAVAQLACASGVGRAQVEKWTRSKDEWIGAVGWNVLSRLAQDDDADLSDAWFEGKLDEIEERIHRAPNRTRYSMNNALIGIGIRNARLEKRAVAAAERIGRVEVDHGETGCKTPEAVSYIAKAAAHKRAKAARAKKATEKKAGAKRATAKKATKKKTARRKAAGSKAAKKAGRRAARA